MPLYEYHCQDCCNDFEARRPMAEADQAECPNCEGTRVKRKLGRVSVRGSAKASASSTPTPVFSGG
jgi:putative FmdB family regulatory protein